MIAAASGVSTLIRQADPRALLDLMDLPVVKTQSGTRHLPFLIVERYGWHPRCPQATWATRTYMETGTSKGRHFKWNEKQKQPRKGLF